MSSNSYVEKKIGKGTYGVHLLGARESFSIGLKLTKLTPVLGSFMDSQFSDALDGLKFSTIAEVLLANLDSIGVEEILEKVVWDKIIYNKQGIDIDEHFKGKIGEMLDVVVWVLEVNFKSLFLESTSLRKILTTLKSMGILPSLNKKEEEESLKSEEVLKEE